MDDTVELLLTTAQSGQQFTASAWDWSSGNAVRSYKNGGACAPGALALIGRGDYVLTAERGKPLLHTWPVNSQEQAKSPRLIVPEPVGCLAVAGCYLAAGIGTKLYVWQIESGKLLHVQQKHFRPVTRVAFSGDGDFLLVGGQDGMLVTYSFADVVNLHGNVLAQSEAGQVEPIYKRTDHAMPITDLFVGSFGYKSRFASVSADQTCRVYDLLKGEPLLCLFFDETLTAVVLDAACWNLYVGGVSGTIKGFSLKSPPRNIDRHVGEDSVTFASHNKKVTCLSLNLTATVLASGSDDNKVSIWDTESLQMLRQIDLKSPVTNVRFFFSNENMFAQSFRPKVCLKHLERNFNAADHKFCVSVTQDEDVTFSDDETANICYGRNSERLNSLEAQVESAKVVNHQLYRYMLTLTKKIYKQYKRLLLKLYMYILLPSLLQKVYRNVS